jgi:hypothetical protein
MSAPNATRQKLPTPPIRQRNLLGKAKNWLPMHRVIRVRGVIKI